jgi:hypothetical protein
MKKFFKIILMLVLIYLGAVFTFKFTGICPKSINLMPSIAGYPSNEKAWVKVLSGLKLCPFSEKVY